MGHETVPLGPCDSSPARLNFVDLGTQVSDTGSTMWNIKGYEKRATPQGFDIWATVHNPIGQSLDVLCVSRAQQRRLHALARAGLVAALGWPPEPEGYDPYCATTGELLQLLRDRFHG